MFVHFLNIYILTITIFNFRLLMLIIIFLIFESALEATMTDSYGNIQKQKSIWNNYEQMIMFLIIIIY